VCFKVKELKEEECNAKTSENVIIGPGRWCIERMNEEVHVQNTAYEPIVEAILEQVEERHSVIRETVNEESLVFSLKVVAHNHGNTKLLVIGKGSFFSVNLFLEHDKKKSNQNGSEILNNEYSLPGNLSSEILKYKCNFFRAVNLA